MSDDVISQIKYFSKYPRLDSFKWSLNSMKGLDWEDYVFFYNDTGNRRGQKISKELIDRVLNQFKKTWREWEDACEPIRKRNFTVTEHNAYQVEKLVNIMREFGIPDSYSVIVDHDKNDRVRQEAGYLADIRRAVPVDQYDMIQERIEKKFESIRRYGLENLEQ